MSNLLLCDEHSILAKTQSCDTKREAVQTVSIRWSDTPFVAAALVYFSTRFHWMLLCMLRLWPLSCLVYVHLWMQMYTPFALDRDG